MGVAMSALTQEKNNTRSHDSAFTIKRIDAWACRAPITGGSVATSFGIMRDRPAVFVRIEDGDGCFGWGEIFANWPAAGAEHRVNLLMDDIADLAIGRLWQSPEEMFWFLDEKTQVRAIQCGEQGPFAHVIAGLDIAAWDLVSRRAGLPLAKAINSGAHQHVPIYASGIQIGAAQAEIERAREAGFDAFKVKVGFGPDDASRLVDLSNTIDERERLFADANQAWSLDEAKAFLQATRSVSLGWMEEPLRVDDTPQNWAELAALCVPLAGGENMAGKRVFAEAIASGCYSFLQPDVAKWGGISGCYEVAREIVDAGRIYCPHFLGGGIGLAASAHLLAAVGGSGLLEVDFNSNILRTDFSIVGKSVNAGNWAIGSEPGIGVTELPAAALATVSLARSCFV